jgi:hypothetical protein
MNELLWHKCKLKLDSLRAVSTPVGSVSETHQLFTENTWHFYKSVV